MKRRIFAGLAAATAVTASLLISGIAPASADPAAATASTDDRGGPRSPIPDAIKITDPTLKIVASLRGVGVQVYQCTSTGTYTLREPVATLGGREGPVAIHGKGPFWASFDGSRVDGSSPVSAPAPNPTADIPWLKVVGTPVPDAPGVFGKVKFIQRLETRGGVAPTSCTAPSTVAVKYSANYVFWAPVGS